LDIPDIQIVVQYGLPSNMPSMLQRCGRGGRSSSIESTFVLMHEEKAVTIPIPSTPEALLRFKDDPDSPIGGPTLSSDATKFDRTGCSIYRCIQPEEGNECLRKYFAAYLNDTSPDGTPVISPMTLT